MVSGWLEGIAFNNILWTLVQKRLVLPVWSGSVELPEDAVVLEVGCGRGIGSTIIMDAFKPSRIDAIDLDERMVKKAQGYLHGEEYEDRIEVSCGDVSMLGGKADVYDAVFDFFTLKYVNDWMKGLSEISRVLKPGGFFAFGELYGFEGNWLNVRSGRRFDRRQLVKALAENNLRLMEAKRDLWGHGLVGVARKATQ